MSYPENPGKDLIRYKTNNDTLEIQIGSLTDSEGVLGEKPLTEERTKSVICYLLATFDLNKKQGRIISDPEEAKSIMKSDFMLLPSPTDEEEMNRKSEFRILRIGFDQSSSE